MLSTLFKTKIPADRLLEKADLSHYSTMRVGGPADLLIEPGNVDELISAIRLAEKEGLPFLVMGNGSNLLFPDAGFRGIVIHIGKNYSDICCDGTALHAQSGAMLSTLSRIAADHSLTGLEFASGIPGSVGGAVYMNAGAYGGEISQVLVQAQVYMDGDIRLYSAPELAFSYRHSLLSDHPGVVLSADFQLQKGDAESIQKLMTDLNARRREKQPLQYPSCGSFFKRPAGHFAGALIEQAGLKGFSIGDAQVSALHAGFIINRGHATARDIILLMQHVQKTVFDRSGIMLEPEVKLIGNFDL